MQLRRIGRLHDPERLRLGSEHRQRRWRTSCSPDTVFDTSELITNPYVQQRWHDLEFYMADSYKLAPRWTADFGLRFSHMQPPFMEDDQMGNFVPGRHRRRSATRSCNGIQYPPGTNPCPASVSRAEATGRTASSFPPSPCGWPRVSASPGTSTATARWPSVAASAGSTSATG